MTRIFTVAPYTILACLHWPFIGKGTSLSLHGGQLQGSESCSFWFLFCSVGSGGGRFVSGGWFAAGGFCESGCVVTGVLCVRVRRGRWAYISRARGRDWEEICSSVDHLTTPGVARMRCGRGGGCTGAGWGGVGFGGGRGDGGDGSEQFNKSWTCSRI